MNQYQKNLTHRTEMLLGSEILEQLKNIRVIIFGLGGVGSWCAESLVRSGLVNLTIVDSDIVCATNVNRQVEATSATVGKPKTEVLSQRLLEINPEAKIVSMCRAWDKVSEPMFKIPTYDYVIDAIDSYSNKLHLLETCVHSGIRVFSSMGAAAKVDPSHIRVAKLTDTTVCPLARRVRKELHRRDVPTDFLCVFSDEPPVVPKIAAFCGTGACTCDRDRMTAAQKGMCDSVDWCARKKRIYGAIVHITAIFGFMLAGLVIQDLLKNQSDKVPDLQSF